MARQASGTDAGELFREAVAIMARLRGPDGCPWDREQTPETIRKYTLEETYEVLDAIDRKHPADLCEELGDLLLQVLFYAQMSSEEGDFTIGDVIAGLNRKLVRRHPHVFGEQAAAEAGNTAVLSSSENTIDANQVLRNWNSIKQQEKKNKLQDEVAAERLAGVLTSQPALLEAGKLGSAAARIGFDWPDSAGLIEKIYEELEEVKQELQPGQPPTAALQMELGDLLFVTANLARHLKVEPELALRGANGKFRRRFAGMENAERTDGGAPLEERSLEELEGLWQDEKRKERSRK